MAGSLANPQPAASPRPEHIHLLEPPKVDWENITFLYGYVQPIVSASQDQPIPSLLASEHTPIPTHTNINNWPYLPEGSGEYFLYAPYSLKDAQEELRHKPESVHLEPVDTPYKPEELEPLFGLDHHMDATLPPLQPETRRMKIFEMTREEYFEMLRAQAKGLIWGTRRRNRHGPGFKPTKKGK